VSVRVLQTSSEEETIALGRELAKELIRPVTVLLIGDLGAGKTTLAKGIVEGLGAANQNDVSSPTFTLIHEYGDHVYHIDLYRLDTEAQVVGLGLQELLDRDAVVLVEWGERFPSIWPMDRVEVEIRAIDDAREFTITRLNEPRA
jgi:tRNA threonylcarbamoyladenosine biosynthesis protein TsaE